MRNGVTKIEIAIFKNGSAKTACYKQIVNGIYNVNGNAHRIDTLS